MPHTVPLSSMTGRQLIRLEISFDTASTIGVLRLTVIGLRVMIWSSDLERELGFRANALKMSRSEMTPTALR